MANGKSKPREDCRWKADEDGVYHTECDNAFFFDTGAPADNKFKFCPYCGAKLSPGSAKESK